MARVTNNQSVLSWVQDHITYGHARALDTAESLHVNEQGELVYHRIGKEGYRVDDVRERFDYNKGIRVKTVVGTKRVGFRREFGPIILGVYVTSTKTFLLNGDGINDDAATQAQTLLRIMVQQPWERFSNTGALWSNRILTLKKKNGGPINRIDGPFRHVIVPFEALLGAEIDRTTVLPIDVTEDTWVTANHLLPDPPTKQEFLAAKVSSRARSSSWRYRTVRKDRVLWRTMEQRLDRGLTSRGTIHSADNAIDQSKGKYDPKQYNNTETHYRGYPLKPGWSIIQEWKLTDSPLPSIPGHLEVRVQATEGVRWVTPRQARGFGVELDGIPNGSWYWEDRYHQLGASVFSARGEDRRRHKYISAFDNNETPPMYFLAQLPDGSKATTYQEAMDALAPEIVHKAWQDNRQVFRQGDVFAIETGLSEKQVYEMARTRVKRSIVIWSNTGRIPSEEAVRRVIHEEITDPRPVKEETTERITCPCGCGVSKRIGWGPRAQRALSIYRTGHTATEVVTTKSGATYIRGIMFHDPQLETPGRRAEHTPVNLGMTAKDRTRFFLCVRNTVPRRSNRLRNRGNTESTETPAAA